MAQVEILNLRKKQTNQTTTTTMNQTHANRVELFSEI